MKKETASVAILVLFVFLIISLLLLYMFSSLEMRMNMSKNMYDGLQSSYISESIANIVLEEKVKESDLTCLYKRDSIEMEDMSFEEGISRGIILRRRRSLENNFSTFILEVVSDYKKIESKTQIVGEMVNKVFYQEDGILSRNEIEKAEYADKILKDLFEDFGKENWNINGLTLSIQNRLKAKTKSKTIFLENSEIDQENFFSKDNHYPEINLSLNNFITVDGEIEFEDETEYIGIIRIAKDGAIRANTKLTISGVLILEEGAELSGRVVVNGLLIDLGNNALAIESKLNCEIVEKYLQSLDGFLVFQPTRTKKSIL